MILCSTLNLWSLVENFNHKIILNMVSVGLSILKSSSHIKFILQNLIFSLFKAKHFYTNINQNYQVLILKYLICLFV